MGLAYGASQTSTAVSATNDSVSLKAVNRSFLLREFVVSGLGTASAANELALARNTGGTVTTDMLPKNTQAPATSITKFGVGQATTLTTVLIRFGVNANGALFRWVAAPGLAPEAGVAEQMGIKGISGSSLMATDMTIEQM